MSRYALSHGAGCRIQQVQVGLRFGFGPIAILNIAQNHRLTPSTQIAKPGRMPSVSVAGHEMRKRTTPPMDSTASPFLTA